MKLSPTAHPRAARLSSLAAALLAAALAPASHAAEPNGLRCAVIAPVTVSSYLDFLGRLGNGSEEGGVARRAGSTRDLLALFGELGCDSAALQGAIECVTGKALSGTTRGDMTREAQQCLKDAGFGS